MNKLYEVRIPKQVSFTEWEIYKVEATSEDEALTKVKNNEFIGEVQYDDCGDYETLFVDYPETQVEEV